MRVVIICGAGYVSGKEKIMLSLLKGFAQAGDEVYCITSSWGNGQFEEMLVSENIAYSKIRLGFISKTLDWDAIRMTMIQLIYWPKLLYNYNKIIAGFKPDVIIHTNFHHAFLLYPVIKAGRMLNIYHSHESINNTKFYRRLFLRFQKKMNLFVGVSDYVTNKLAVLGISKDKLKTIHNGVEIIDWTAKPLIPGKVFQIGIIGQIGAWKGHEDLLLAVDLIKNSYPDMQFKLCIFGDGKAPFIEQLKDLIREKKLDGYIEWKGFVKDIKAIYGELQLVCVPSRSEEPFATTVLEAGLFAVPVIVTSKGGFPELVKPGYSGFIVEANAPGEIASQLSILVKDPDLALQAGLNLQRVVKEKFSFQNFINNWKTTLSVLNSN